MATNSSDDQKKKNLGGILGKVLTVASTGFTAAKVFHDQQQIKASENLKNAAIATANQHISTANTAVNMVETQATEHIAGVLQTVNAVDSITNANNVDAFTDVASILSIDTVNNTTDLIADSEGISDMALNVVESMFDWFDS
jgi:hypothetical protein